MGRLSPASYCRKDLFAAVGKGWISFLVPYLVAAIWFVFFPEYNALGATLANMVLFAFSIEIVLGFGGINTLGQAVMFGCGAYASGLAAIHLGWSDPFAMLAVGMAAGAMSAFVTGLLVLRGSELTVLAMTIVTAAIFYELSNTLSRWTGGFDGLRGITVRPVFGVFEFDLWGKTAFILSVGTVLLAHGLVLLLATSPFGVMMRGLRENPSRMSALGTPVGGRLLMIYCIGGLLAGLAGSLQTVTTSYVTNEVFAFYISATVIVVMILGGFGRTYGAFIGSAIYVIFQDYLAKIAPEYWFFWLGLLLVVIVVAAPRGILGLLDRSRSQAGQHDI